MPLFEDWGKRLSEVAKSAGKMTRDVAETTRINLQINTRHEEIEKCYLQLGKAYYARQAAGGGSTEAMDALCSQIAGMIAECEDLQRQVDDLKGQRRCPNCGSVQSATSSFCSECGERLLAERPASPAEGVTITWPEAAQSKDQAEQPLVAEPEVCESPEVSEVPEAPQAADSDEKTPEPDGDCQPAPNAGCDCLADSARECDCDCGCECPETAREADPDKAE